MMEGERELWGGGCVHVGVAPGTSCLPHPHSSIWTVTRSDSVPSLPQFPSLQPLPGVSLSTDTTLPLAQV